MILRAEIVVYTYKDGALSALAHDLKLRVACDVETNEARTEVRASVDAASLKVVCAMRDGHEAPGALPGIALMEIERNMARDVLRTRQFPRIAFVTTSIEPLRVAGTLHLCGRERAVALTCERRGDNVVGRTRIDQREFGITPFSAMLGTLRIKPHVDVEVRVTAG